LSIPIKEEMHDTQVAYQSKKPKADLDPIENVSEVRKKRLKTRSKQKNIRKDRRADHIKPEYLQIGNASYAGRPLSDVCHI